MIFIAPRVVHARSLGGGSLLVTELTADAQAAAYSTFTHAAERRRV